MKVALKKVGKTYEIRERKTLRNALTAGGGALYRNTGRERAKEVLHKFLSQSFETEYMLAKVRKTLGNVIFV